MKTKTRALLLTLCAVLLVAASVFGTMAYLTSDDSVTNTFTVGSVDIKLDEAKVGENGKKVTPEERVKENAYHLLPGHEYDKDPTVTVLEGSDDAYVRLLVEARFENVLKNDTLATSLDTIFTGYSVSNWNRVGRTVKNNVTVGEGKDAKTYGTVIYYEYRYKETVAAPTADVKLPALFTGIQIPGEWTKEDMAAIGKFDIHVVANAIQADGFDNADAAWKAFA